MEDKKESFEHDRNMVEYNASFVEPEAVKRIRESRDQAIDIPEDQFMSGISKIFGRPLGPVVKQKDKEMHKMDVSKVLTEYQKTVREKPQAFSYKDWTKINLG